MATMYLSKFNKNLKENDLTEIYNIYCKDDSYYEYCLSYKKRYEDSLVLEEFYREALSYCCDNSLVMDSNISSLETKCEKEYLDIQRHLSNANKYKKELKGLIKIDLFFWNSHKEQKFLMDLIYQQKGKGVNLNRTPLLISKRELERIIKAHKDHLYNNEDTFKDANRDIIKKSLKNFEMVLKLTDFKKETLFCNYLK